MGHCPPILAPEDWQKVKVAIRLSPREADVAALCLKSLTADLIAKELGLKPDTVRTYLKRVYLKAGIHSRLELLELVIILAYPADDGKPRAVSP